MTAQVGVLVIHGIGAQKKDFADDMIEEVNRRISKSGKNSSDVAWQTVYWADIMEPRQKKFLKDAKKSADLDYIGLRRFMCSALGDASGYQQVSGQNNPYERIHAQVKDSVHGLYVNVLNGSPKPLLIMAHSLGGHILSNYIWDLQHSNNPQLSPFERMEWLTGMITFGCNLPLFTFAHNVVEPIEFPPSQLSAALKAKARWDNYYDPDDILGYPLKPLNAKYRKTVNSDIAINVGGLFSQWNPLSHTKYWTDNDFTKPVAKYIGKFL